MMGTLPCKDECIGYLSFVVGLATLTIQLAADSKRVKQDQQHWVKAMIKQWDNHPKGPRLAIPAIVHVLEQS